MIFVTTSLYNANASWGEFSFHNKPICESECKAEARGDPLLTEAFMRVCIAFVPQSDLL